MRWRTLAGFGVVALVSAIAPVSPAGAADMVTEVGGGAFGVSAAVLGTVGIAASPEVILPKTGGFAELASGEVFDDGTLTGHSVFVVSPAIVRTAGHPEPFPEGATYYAASSVDIARVRLDLGGGPTYFEGVHAECLWNPAGASGSTSILRRDGTGQAIAPNTSLPVAGGSLVLNEQFIEHVGSRSVIYVNAIHAVVNAGAQKVDIIIGQASCDPNGGGTHTAGLTQVTQSLCGLLACSSPVAF